MLLNADHAGASALPVRVLDICESKQDRCVISRYMMSSHHHVVLADHQLWPRPGCTAVKSAAHMNRYSFQWTLLIMVRLEGVLSFPKE